MHRRESDENLQKNWKSSFPLWKNFWVEINFLVLIASSVVITKINDLIESLA